MRSLAPHGVVLVVAAAALYAGAVTTGAVGEERRATCLERPATIIGTSGGRIIGTPRADVIVGSARGDEIFGRGGNDRICGGGGNDLIVGGRGSDRVDAGGGDDRIYGGNGSDWMFGGSGDDFVIGNRGNDRLLGGHGQDFVDGGLGDDVVSGGPGHRDQVIGGVGNDRLYGGPGREDVLRGDQGADVLDGGHGEHDVASFAVSGFTGPVQGGHGVEVDLLEGFAKQDGNDRLVGIEDVLGTAFNDVIRGNAAENVLYGGGGDDQLVAVGANDVAIGGPGSDSCDGFAVIESCGREPPPTENSVEIGVPGGPARSSLTAAFRSAPFIPGSDVRPEALGVRLKVSFESGSWIVRSDPLPIVAGDHCEARSRHEGTCAIDGFADAVLVSGGPGNDEIEIDHAIPPTVSAFLRGDRGTDVVLGGPGDDSLNGGPGDGDILRGRGGDDALANGHLLTGGPGSDLLIAAPCAGQRIHGGPGVDSVSFARSYLRLGAKVRLGGDAVLPPHRLAGRSFPAGCPIAGTQPTRIASSVENVEGSPEADIIIGDNSPNILLGRGGDDVIMGRGGNDFLVGGRGADTLLGGPGWDRIYARDGAADRSLSCGPGNTRRDVARVDRRDPVARGCRLLLTAPAP